jgi:hypothetical protein
MDRPTRARVVPLVALFLAGCGGSSTGSSSAPTPTATPAATSGTIRDLQAARDIVRFNQTAQGGSSFRRSGVICRWELPVPVYVAAGVNREAVAAALEHWRERTGITSRIVTEDVEPRILIRTGDDGLGAGAGARGIVDGTRSDNSARSGIVVIRPSVAACATDCRFIFRHELGHTFGVFDHMDASTLMGSGSVDLTPREEAMMRTLYSLPHGTRVEDDGSWRVALP